ncbi:MAG: hypothetical protein V4582_18860 [Pseudomonadota bacterium]
MKNEKLTTDEYDALEQILRGARHDRVNACVGRNVKRLSGLKLVQYGKDGRISMTDKGQQLLFLRRCILGLRAVAQDAASTLEADVALFLGKKSHIQPGPDGSYLITDKGRESLCDIEAQEKSK